MFLRGAIITAQAELFRQQQGEIWFIEEEIADYTDNTPRRFQGKNLSRLVEKSVATLGSGQKS